MTTKDKILSHLKTEGSIDTWTAIGYFRCTRLSEYIRILRSEGNEIFSEWVTDGKKRWVSYRLVTR